MDTEQPKVDDYTSYTERGTNKIISVAEGDSLIMVVRPGNTYGKTPAGGLVRIAKRDLVDKTTQRALMTIEEHGAEEAERVRRREARKPKAGSLKARVEAEIAAMKRPVNVRKVAAERK